VGLVFQGQSLERNGASFFVDLARQTGRLPSEVEDALWELLAGGFVTADGFDNLRALIDPKRRRGEGRGSKKRPRHAAGRWALLRHVKTNMNADERLQVFANGLKLFTDESADGYWRKAALSGVAEALAATDPDRAERVAQSITKERLKVWTLVWITEV